MPAPRNKPAESTDPTSFERWTRDQQKGQVIRLANPGAALEVVRLDAVREKRVAQVVALFAGAPADVRDAAVASVEPDTEDMSEVVAKAVISNERVDSYDSTINVDGWERADFKRNPVVLFAHASWELPIGRDLGTYVDNERRALIGVTRFVSKKLGEQESKVGSWVAAGLLNATSVGFEPLEWEVAEDRDDGSSWWMPVDFLRQALREYSWVPVPANADCLVDARAALAGTGLSARDFRAMIEESLEDAGVFYVPRSTLLSLRRELPGSQAVIDMGELGAFTVAEDRGAHEHRDGGDLTCPGCGHTGPASTFTPAAEEPPPAETAATMDNTRGLRNDARQEDGATVSVEKVGKVLGLVDQLALGRLP
jgi:hypothetical protein